MKTILSKIPYAVLGALLGIALPAMAATQYGAGSLLQIGDVKSSHILNGTILNADVSSSASLGLEKIDGGTTDGTLYFSNGGKIASSSSLTFATTTKKLVVSGGSIEATSTNFNGVGYTWPSADGSSGQSLTTSGASVLSWANSAPTKLYSAFTSGEALTAGNAVRITSDTIAFDATSTAKIIAGNATATLSHALTGNNTLLVVGILNANTNGLSTVTFNGVAMTLSTSTTNSSYINYLYTLATTTSATANIVVTRAATTGTMWVTAASYVGVQQTGQPDSASSSFGSSGTSRTCTNTTVANNTWSVMFAYGDNGGVAASTNSTLIASAEAATAVLFDSSAVAPKSPAGSFAMTANMTSGWEGCLQIALVPLGGNVIKKASAASAAKSQGFIGFAAATVASNASVNVDIGGLINTLSGLTVGTPYYLSDTTGAVSTSAGTVSHKVGIAASSTALIITNIW